MRGLEDVRTAERTSLIMIGRSYSFWFPHSLRGEASRLCGLDNVMRGAAALAYLSLQQINLRFDWMENQIRNSPETILPLTITMCVLDRPKIPCAFNDLRFVVHDMAWSGLGDGSCSVRRSLGFYAANTLPDLRALSTYS